jgi:HEPN domain-containing protein
MNTNHVLLYIAERDLAAAESLFEKKLYPQAVFYLQQAVEKATKSFALHNNIISEDELKEISHASLKIYLKIVEEHKNKVKEFQELIKKLPKLKHTTLFKKYEDISSEKFDEMLDKFEFYLKHSNRKISDKEMEETISELINLETEIENKEIKSKNEVENFRHLFQEVANTFAGEHPELRENIKRGKKRFESLTPELMEELISFSISQAIYCNHLLFLSLILCPHVISSRYPYPEHGHNPLMVYTVEHPIIKRFDRLTQITKGVLERMKLFSENFQKTEFWSELTGG